VIASVRGMGCDLEELLRRGLIEIVFIPQPEIVVEKHLLMMKDAIERTGAKRIAVDSSSVFVHKITDPQTVREMIFQLTTLIQMTQAVGLFSSDIPYGSDRISRFGVEETVADGIILPSAVENAKTLKRNRFLKIYKLRNTAQANGRHRIEIGPGGIAVTGSSLKPRPASGRTRQVRAKGKKPR
jgi:circadian clock protein KaiC